MNSHQADNAAIQAVLRQLPELDRFAPAAVYLYGSAAQSRMHATSDYDIALLPTSPCDPVEIFDAANAMAQQLGRDVDLIDLSRATTVMRKEVLRTGILLHETQPMRRIEFEMHALSAYARLNEARQAASSPDRPSAA